MDWFHCNQCFTKRGSKFAVSSCGHICCEACITSKQCSVCRASCSYLPITDEMKPQEKVFFQDPVKLIQSRMEHISQIALFQRTQMEKVTAHFKHKSVELERRLKEVTEQGYSTQRMSLPVAVTSPVTPRSRPISHIGSAESQGLARDRGPSLSSLTTPGSATSRSSHSPLHEHGHRTPSSLSTPTRTQRQTPNVFPFQFMSGLSILSPRR
ncbi:RING finger protein 212B-like isoform X3 [Thunnus albacares]|uniref:RING finger protein 212B-like isoform X3 n=1 Tax=Thunnus maccoyii TaxID=8240 RepID=UPI001C4DB010|nr:RING finger protein 212B-like isoform X3 [Thunnus maccoyii]XP_044224928.1 RING finger protein 212B-like isoform X3 [Thunnus albacares]